MALGRQGERQGDLVVTWKEMPRSPGHVFYDRLQGVLIDAGCDVFAETACQPYYAAKMGAPSIPPGRYFRMHMVGYFEGIDSERGIEWRCADSLSLREFLRLGTTARVPDHSWLSKTRSRLPHEVHEEVCGWVPALIARHDLVKGERIGVDASTMEANAALRTIVRRETGETYREMLKRMAAESGTPPNTEVTSMSRLNEAGPAHRAVAATSFTVAAADPAGGERHQARREHRDGEHQRARPIHRDRARQDVRRMDGDQGEAEPVRNAALRGRSAWRPPTARRTGP